MNGKWMKGAFPRALVKRLSISPRRASLNSGIFRKRSRKFSFDQNEHAAESIPGVLPFCGDAREVLCALPQEVLRFCGDAREVLRALPRKLPELVCLFGFCP